MNSFTLSNNSYVKYFNGTDSIDAYHAQLRKYPPLSEDEEIELFKRIEETGDKEALDKIVLHNQRFVYSNAKQYARDEDEVFDYINEGIIGLMLAIEKFKVESGNRFITYAVWYVRRQMNYYLINTRDCVVRSNAMKLFKKTDKVVEKFFAENGRIPTDEEIAELLEATYGNIKIKDIRELYDIQMVSIQGINSDDCSFEESPEFTDKTSCDNEYDTETDSEYNKIIAHKLMKVLSPREQKIIKAMYGIGYERAFTIEEAADKFGISISSINKMKDRIIKKLMRAYYFGGEERLAV